MSAALGYFNVDVDPGLGKSTILDITGSIFVCEEATARFEMQFDDGGRFPCKGGFILRPPGGFTRVAFYNLTTEKLTVDIYVGDTSVSYDYERIRKTRLVSTSLGIAAGANLTFAGTNSGNRRKSFRVRNRDLTLELYVRKPPPDATVTEVVYPKLFVELETDADLDLWNPGGSNISIAVAELFYMT